jgi:hypothetical protein
MPLRSSVIVTALDLACEMIQPGHREACAPRDTGVLCLVPGSLGASTTQTWHFKEFPAPDGVTSALAFLNASPRQGAGEVSGYARNDGSAVIFYLEPGTN